MRRRPSAGTTVARSVSRADSSPWRARRRLPRPQERNHHGLRHRHRNSRQRRQRRHRGARPRPPHDPPACRASAPAVSGQRRGPPRSPPDDAHADRPPPRLLPRRVQLLDVALPRDRERSSDVDALASPSPCARGRGPRLGGARHAPQHERQRGHAGRRRRRAPRARRARPGRTQGAPRRLPRRGGCALHLDLGLQEIADKLAITESAVRSRLHRARTRLRSLLENDEVVEYTRAA